MHRLLHFMSPSGHLVRHATSPRRSPSEIAGSWAFASVMVVAAEMLSINKNVALLRKSNIASYPAACKYRANHQPGIQSFKLIRLRQHSVWSLAGLIAATGLASARCFALRLRSHPDASPQNSYYLNGVILTLAMPILLPHALEETADGEPTRRRLAAFRSRRPSLAPA
jgi:hypothetical protein